MHQSSAGSSVNAFQTSSNPTSFFESPTHEEALARLHFLVENGRRAGLLVGQGGTGKSLMLRVFTRQVKCRNCQTALVDLVGLESNEMLWQIAIQLGLNLDADSPRHTIWRMLSDRISENRYQQITTVIMLDNVDQASQDILQQVQRLLHIDSSPESKLTVLLSTNVDNMQHIDPRLLTLADLRIELESWDECDTARYLSHCLSRAGRNEVVFEPCAAACIRRLSGGIPRRINRLAELALIAIAGRQGKSIDEQTVASVYEELSVAIAH